MGNTLQAPLLHQNGHQLRTTTTAPEEAHPSGETAVSSVSVPPGSPVRVQVQDAGDHLNFVVQTGTDAEPEPAAD